MTFNHALLFQLLLGLLVLLGHLASMLTIGKVSAPLMDLPQEQFVRLLLMLLSGCLRNMCMDPAVLAPIEACHLIALDKQPGVRPIGVGDTARCIIAEAILTVIREDVLDVTGAIQLCTRQIAGSEAAIHGVGLIVKRCC